MKKTIIVVNFALVSFFASAQLKVNTNGKVGIGNTSPLALLDVGATALNGSGNFFQFGYGKAKSYTTLTRVGMLAQSNESVQPFGIYVAAQGAASSSGMIGVLQTGVENNCNCGILALNGFGGTVGIGTLSPTSMLSVNGSADKSGGGSWGVYSDQKLKENISSFTDGLSVLKQINPIWFNYNGKGGIKTKDKFVGVIAQDAQKIMPYTVTTVRMKLDSTDVNESDILRFDPSSLDFILINSVKEQQQMIDSLKTAIADLKNCCTTKGQRTSNNGQGRNENTLQIELANKDNTILYQNEPNPFNGSTVIRYFIPENTTGSSYISFYDMYGKEIKKLEVTQKGFGRIEANTENLASGIYSYSLIINDKVIDTKKMVKNQ